MFKPLDSPRSRLWRTERPWPHQQPEIVPTAPPVEHTQLARVAHLWTYEPGRRSRRIFGPRRSRLVPAGSRPRRRARALERAGGTKVVSRKFPTRCARLSAAQTRAVFAVSHENDRRLRLGLETLALPPLHVEGVRRLVPDVAAI